MESVILDTGCLYALGKFDFAEKKGYEVNFPELIRQIKNWNICITEITLFELLSHPQFSLNFSENMALITKTIHPHALQLVLNNDLDQYVSPKDIYVFFNHPHLHEKEAEMRVVIGKYVAHKYAEIMAYIFEIGMWLFPLFLQFFLDSLEISNDSAKKRMALYSHNVIGGYRKRIQGKLELYFFSLVQDNNFKDRNIRSRCETIFRNINLVIFPPFYSFCKKSFNKSATYSDATEALKIWNKYMDTHFADLFLGITLTDDPDLEKPGIGQEMDKYMKPVSREKFIAYYSNIVFKNSSLSIVEIEYYKRLIRKILFFSFGIDTNDMKDLLMILDSLKYVDGVLPILSFDQGMNGIISISGNSTLQSLQSLQSVLLIKK